jgi:hypothetical protein
MSRVMHFLAPESKVPERKPMKTSKAIFNLSAGHTHRHSLNEYTLQRERGQKP